MRLYFCPIIFDRQQLFFNQQTNFFLMKNVLSILAFVVCGVFFAQAQNATGAVMTFDVMTVDYGTIEKGGDPIRRFKFTNTGAEPLIVKAAKGSCGCTVPTYPKEPIMPGESNVIEVRYDTQRVGAFTKTVTLTTNETSDTHTLTIKGEVKAPAEEQSVPVGNGGLKQ